MALQSSDSEECLGSLAAAHDNAVFWSDLSAPDASSCRVSSSAALPPTRPPSASGGCVAFGRQLRGSELREENRNYVFSSAHRRIREIKSSLSWIVWFLESCLR